MGCGNYSVAKIESWQEMIPFVWRILMIRYRIAISTYLPPFVFAGVVLQIHLQFFFTRYIQQIDVRLQRVVVGDNRMVFPQRFEPESAV